MDDIATHASRLVKPYVRSKNAAAIIESAKRLARVVVSDAELLEQHKKKVLSLAQWFVSEADGKYKTRFRSKAVVDLAMYDPTSRMKINHDHVYTRSDITTATLAQPEHLDSFLEGVLGCVVTQEEHLRLPKGKLGWARYTAAGIVVLDMSITPPAVANVA